MNPDELLPLQEPTFLILLCLRGGEKHGYAILKEVGELSGGRVKLSTGTLYGALNRLLDQGLIERVGEGAAKGARGAAEGARGAAEGARGGSNGANGARGKKGYRLTVTGLEVYDAEVGRMRRLLAAASRRLAGGTEA